MIAVAPDTLPVMPEHAIQSMMQRDWPGNIRELKSILQSAVNLARGEPISEPHLPLHIKSSVKECTDDSTDADMPSIKPLAEMEKDYDVFIVTQNVDDLHERAGSTNIIHLHGELCKSRSTLDPDLVYDIEGWELNPGDLCEKGSQLRPHIVWFGEAVPAIEEAAAAAAGAELLSLNEVLCPGEFCPSVVDDIVVFRDNHHITGTGLPIGSCANNGSSVSL